MEYETFRQRVRVRGELPSDDAAERAIRATLVTLSERVPDDDARDLAEQLPGDVGNHLTAADGRESFGYDEFVARVAEREGDASPDLDAAERHARAVIAVLLDAVRSRDSDDLLSALTEDYEALLAFVDPEDVWGPGWRHRLGQHG